MPLRVRTRPAIASSAALQQKGLAAEWALPRVKTKFRVDAFLQEAAARHAGHLNIGAVGAGTLALGHSFALILPAAIKKNTPKFLETQDNSGSMPRVITSHL